jgi:hypothetical protein
MRSVAFSDASHGVAVTTDTIVRTSDGGLTWTTVDLPLSAFLNAVTWAGPTTVVIAGDGGVLLRNQRSGALSVAGNRPLAVRGMPTRGPLATTKRAANAAGAAIGGK